MSTTKFDVTPEKRATMLAFIKRQLFGAPPATKKSDVNLKGKTAVVTGSNTGIGLECSRHLLDLGLSRLIIAVRNTKSGEAARDQLLKGRSSSAHTIEVWKLDLSVYDSVTSFAEKCKTLDDLHIFIHNAGISKLSFELNPITGHEETIQVNYLSAALLLILMLPVMHKRNSPTHPGKLVLVNSDVSAWSKLKERNETDLLSAFDKPETFNNAEYGQRYYTSKLLGQLFLAELANRVPASSVIVNAPNPGLCKSSLMREASGTGAGLVISLFLQMLGFSAATGAWSFVDAACNYGPESHGVYIESGKLQPSAPLVYSAEGAKIRQKLWDETMAELRFAGVEDIIKQLSVNKAD